LQQSKRPYELQNGECIMIDVYTVCFFGRRQLDDLIGVERRLERIIRKLLAEREYVEFLVGRNGEFDQAASSTILRLKRTVRDDNNALVLVLPYLTAEYTNNRDSFEKYYDEIEICEIAAGKYFKSAIQIRNREMINRSDLVVCYIERKKGGAYHTVQYAKKQGKKIINIKAA